MVVAGPGDYLGSTGGGANGVSRSAPETTFRPQSAASRGLAVCHTCAKVETAVTSECSRCGAHMHLRKPHSVQKTAAFAIAAAVLYLPANMLPIMTVESLGVRDESTILGGVVTLWNMHSYPIALIIFIASVAIPILKLISITFLCYGAMRPVAPIPATRLYRLTELLGRWSMVDVFVVAILAAMVQMGTLMNIHPGPAAISFAAVVILTMFSAMSFDPRLIWDRAHHAQSGKDSTTSDRSS
ncbi:MAG: paraquat-inducible protein A [Verrucomicrobiae bacterium]|nr:paraquat-inducible protein A [Verrucomicrobiae bacterium]